MRHKSEVLVILAVSAFALTGVTALRIMQLGTGTRVPAIVDIPPRTTNGVGTTAVPTDARAWFQSFRMYCNPVDVDTRMRWQPAPGSAEGDMYKAACYALAGQIDDARASILAVPAERRYVAAGVVFEAIHPAADAGDEAAAGPGMELVVEFWPNHYMALYHAGAAAFEREEYGPAWDYLERFLQEYHTKDGWHSSAESMLDIMTRIEG